MRTHYFRKITSAIGKSIINFYSRINFPTLYKGTFILGYILICTLILLPRIDRQEWYPDQIGIFDFDPSQDFITHNQLTLNVKDTEYLPKTLTIMNDRFTELGIVGYGKKIDGNDIVFDLPKDLPDRIIDLSVGKGEIYLTQRTEETSTDYSPEVMYDPTSYEASPVEISDIQNARIVEQGEGYTSIEITTNKEAVWNTLSQQVSSSTLGLFVDGNLYLAQIVPVGEGILKPRLILLSEEQAVSIVVSQLRQNQLDTVTGYSFNKVPPTYSSDFGIIIFTMILLPVIFGLVHRYFILKDSNRNISQSILIIVGILTISKVIPMTWGILELTILSLIIMIYLINKMSKTLEISIPLIIMGILIDQISNNSLNSIGKLLYVLSIYSVLMYLLLFFTGIYEEN